MKIQPRQRVAVGSCIAVVRVAHSTELCREIGSAEAPIILKILVCAVREVQAFHCARRELVGRFNVRKEVQCTLFGTVDLDNTGLSALARHEREADVCARKWSRRASDRVGFTLISGRQDPR
jgi:hypothetical protein